MTRAICGKIKLMTIVDNPKPQQNNKNQQEGVKSTRAGVHEIIKMKRSDHQVHTKMVADIFHLHFDSAHITSATFDSPYKSKLLF